MTKGETVSFIFNILAQFGGEYESNVELMTVTSLLTSVALLILFHPDGREVLKSKPSKKLVKGSTPVPETYKVSTPEYAPLILNEIASEKLPAEVGVNIIFAVSEEPGAMVAANEEEKGLPAFTPVITKF
jgi:hypothetical protein